MQVIVNGFIFPATAGQYSATVIGWTDIPAWCAEKTQFLWFGEVLEYEHIDGDQAWSPKISLELDRLMSWAAGAGWPADAEQSTAIQRDIWAILDGKEGALSIGQPALTMHANLLHNSMRQDLLVTHAVLEPDPLPMLIAALIALIALRLAR